MPMNPGVQYVLGELIKRGINAQEIKNDRKKNLIEVTSRASKRKITVRVRSRYSGSWQIPSTEGRPGGSPDDETYFWILVDLIDRNLPQFYIMPDWWLRNDIYIDHQRYLEEHGGKRPVTEYSTHHQIRADRIDAWKDGWEILGV